MKRWSSALLLAAGCAVLLSGCAGGPASRPLSEQTPAGPAPEALEAHGRAVTLMQVGDLEQAEQILLMLHEDFPQYAVPLVNLSIVSRRMERPEQAERFLNQALEIDPLNTSALCELGVLLRQRGEFQAAADAYSRAIEADPEHAPSVLNLGILLDLYLDEPEQALVRYERYAELTLGQDARVERWIAELRLRVKADNRTALVEP